MPGRFYTRDYCADRYVLFFFFTTVLYYTFFFFFFFGGGRGNFYYFYCCCCSFLCPPFFLPLSPLSPPLSPLSPPSLSAPYSPSPKSPVSASTEVGDVGFFSFFLGGGTMVKKLFGAHELLLYQVECACRQRQCRDPCYNGLVKAYISCCSFYTTIRHHAVDIYCTRVHTYLILQG